MIAVSMVRDEADVIRETVEILLLQGARVVVSDNRSVDGTRDRLAGLPVTLIQDHDPAYNQSAKMTRLASIFATEGEWVIPFDADEHWHGVDELDKYPDFDQAHARPHVHIGAGHIGPEPFPKVAFRWKPGAVIEMGNHGVTGAGHRILHDVLEVCHFQYRSLEQVRRKVRNGVEAYNHTTMPASFGSHWRQLAALSDQDLEAWWLQYSTRETQPCRL